MPARRMSDALFLAIAHPTRRALLEVLLERGEAGVPDLQAAAGLPGPALSQHLRVLADASLVAARAEGRHRYYRLTPEPLLEVVAWMRGFERAWRDHPDRLGDFLAGQERGASSVAADRRPVPRPVPRPDQRPDH